MSKRPESRRKIEAGIEKRKHGMDDRAKHMGLVVEEKQRIADASRQLHLSTTSEGAQEVKKAMNEAAKATDTEFTKQEGDIKTKFNECEKAERDLQDRTKSARQDATHARNVMGRVRETKEAKARMGAAEKAAKTDAKYTEGQERKQNKHRAEGKRRTDQQKTKLKSTRLAW